MRRMDRQDREIALLTIGNLGKQFRPHFMLNALNSLGAELYDNPHAERIISHIGGEYLYHAPLFPRPNPFHSF